MARPQQPELARHAKTDLDPNHVETGLEGQTQPATGGETGPIPADNQPGHHPPAEQDKPDLAAFAEKLGTKPATTGVRPGRPAGETAGPAAAPKAGAAPTPPATTDAAKPTAVRQPAGRGPAKPAGTRRPEAKTTSAPPAPIRPNPVKSAPAGAAKAKSAPARSASARTAPAREAPAEQAAPKAPSSASPLPAQKAAGVSVPQPPPGGEAGAGRPGETEPEPKLVSLAMLPLRTTISWLEHLDELFTERLTARTRHQ